MNRLEYNGKYGTIEVVFDVALDKRFLASPVIGIPLYFPSAHHAMDYLKKQFKKQ